MARKARTATQWPESPVVLRMIAKNIPLSQWRQYMETGNGDGFFSQKRPEHAAGEIFRQLSHPDAVAIIAHEWDQLTSECSSAPW